MHPETKKITQKRTLFNTYRKNLKIQLSPGLVAYYKSTTSSDETEWIYSATQSAKTSLYTKPFPSMLQRGTWAKPWEQIGASPG